MNFGNQIGEEHKISINIKNNDDSRPKDWKEADADNAFDDESPLKRMESYTPMVARTCSDVLHSKPKFCKITIENLGAAGDSEDEAKQDDDNLGFLSPGHGAKNRGGAGTTT